MADPRDLFRFPALPDHTADDAVDFESRLPLGGGKPRSRADLSFWAKVMTEAASALLAHWGSVRLERAALACALRWNGSTELGRQVDLAFRYYLAWLDEVTEAFQRGAIAGVTSDRAEIQSLELLRKSLAGLLHELQSRAQFVQARAADIRISGKLDEVAKALLDLERDRVVDALVTIVQKQMVTPGRPEGALSADLAKIEAEHPELPVASDGDLQRLGKQVQQEASTRGLDLRSWVQTEGARVIRDIMVGVGGNAVFAWLQHVLMAR